MVVPYAVWTYPEGIREMSQTVSCVPGTPMNQTLNEVEL